MPLYVLKLTAVVPECLSVSKKPLDTIDEKVVDELFRMEWLNLNPDNRLDVVENIKERKM